MSTTPRYFDRYETFALTRSDSGVLTLRFHTNGGPVTFTGTTHSDLSPNPASNEVGVGAERERVSRGPPGHLPRPPRADRRLCRGG